MPIARAAAWYQLLAFSPGLFLVLALAADLLDLAERDAVTALRNTDGLPWYANERSVWIAFESEPRALRDAASVRSGFTTDRAIGLLSVS